MQQKVEGENRTLRDVVNAISDVSSESGRIADDALAAFRPRVVMNMGRSAQDIQLGGRLRQVVRSNLHHDVEFIAYLPHDELAARSPLDRAPTLLAHPQSAYAKAVHQCAARVIHEPLPDGLKLFPDDEDLRELANDFSGARRTPPDRNAPMRADTPTVS
jgi:flagellar biosynthesis protein FlhG